MKTKMRKNYRPLIIYALLLTVLSTGVLTTHSSGYKLLNRLGIQFGLATPTPTPQPKTSKPKRSSAATRPASAENSEGLFDAARDLLQQPLAATDFNLIGLVGTAAPATQTVPKNVPTAIPTSIQVPEGSDAAAIIATLNPNYRIRGELSGPSFTAPRRVEAPIGQSLPIPPLPNAGDHVVQNLRIIDITDPTGQTLAPVMPDSCGITVIERLLVSQVQVTEMTYDQIVQSGINLTGGNYNFYNFVLALGTGSNSVSLQIPVALPSTGNFPPVVGNPQIPGGVSGVSIPDIYPVMLGIDGDGDGEPDPPPPGGGSGGAQIPGVLVFPGRIGLLHQFFEAIVIVANGAPDGTPLVITNLRAKAKLPDAGTPDDQSDDPLRIAATQTGGTQSEQAIHGLGADGRYGTADDTVSFNPGQSGQAPFLLEGLREGLHTVDFEIKGTLQGLPLGPVSIVGNVPGAVLVRDARFGVTFTHPSVVRTGQEYDLGLTVYNSGDRSINGVTLALAANSISGATLIDTPEKTISQTIPRGGAATVKWRLRANITGEVTASYIKVGDGIEAGLNLVTGVGDRNVPLSPDSLILPDAVRHLPPDVTEAGRQMLGQAWSVANAPSGTLPPGVLPVDKQTVSGKAIEMGWAGLRIDFGESRDTSLRTLLRDWLGEHQTNSSTGYADALRNTAAGYYFFDVVGNRFSETLGNEPAADFHRKLVAAEAGRSAFISALATQPSGSQIFGAKLVSPNGQNIGWGANQQERSGDLRTAASINLLATDPHEATNNSRGKFLIASKPAAGNWSLELLGWGSGNADVSILAPATGKNYRQLNFTGVPFTVGKRYRITFRSSGTAPPTVEEFIGGSFRSVNLPYTTSDAAEANPEIVGAAQFTPDVIEGGDRFGRLVGVLFSKPMVKTSVETISRYQIGGGELVSDPSQIVGKAVGVTGSSQNFGGRFAILALNSPIGKFIKRNLSVNGATDTSGKTIIGATRDIEARVSPLGIPPGAYLTGRVMNADGSPVPNATVDYQTNRSGSNDCGSGSDVGTVARKRTDAGGEFEFDYVVEGSCSPISVFAVNAATNSTKTVTSNVAYDGQHIVLNAVFLARGNVQGTVTNNGAPVINAAVSIIPELDVRNTKIVRTDSLGRYSATGVPVGGLTVKAVGDGVYSLASGIAGGTLTAPGQTVTINVGTQDISGVIKGKLLDSGDGQTPVRNGIVVAYARIPGFITEVASPIPVGYSYTGQDGGFTINNLPVGDVFLRGLDAEGGTTASITVQLTPQNKRVEGVILLISNGFGRVSGRVLNEIGQIVPNAIVREGSQAVRSDAAGNYILPRVREGNANIAAYDPVSGQTGSTSVSVGRNANITGADVVVSRPANLNGQVFITENGVTQPLAQTEVTVDGRRIVQTDSQGRYTLNSVPSGSSTIRFVYRQRKQFINTNVFLNPGETLVRNATFKPGKIHGRITQPDGVTPVIAGVRLVTPLPNVQEGSGFGLPVDPPGQLSAQTGTDGIYSFEDLNPGNYRISSSNVFFPIPVSQPGNLPPNGDLEINLSLVDSLAGKIHGHIYQPDGTTPVGAGVKVSLGNGGGGLGDVTVPTDGNGYYEFAEVFAEGGYMLTATDPLTRKTNRTGISVRRNEELTVDLRLLGRGTLRVHVIDGGGNSVPGGVVRAEGGDYPNDRRAVELIASANGRCEFTGLTEGGYAVSALYNGLGGRVSANVTLDGVTEVTVQVQAAGSITGRVLMPDGATPVGLADVSLMQNGRIIGFNTTADTEEERGKFTFQGVPANEFTIDVFDNRSGRRGRFAGRINQQGEVAVAEIKLLALGTVTGQVTANGVPAEHALVILFADGSGISSTSRIATTDAEGRYRFVGIPVGNVRISVRNGPGELTGENSGNVVGTIEPLPETVINVALTPTATVVGTVYKVGGAEVYPGASVLVQVGRYFSNTTTDETGRYRVSFVPLGSVETKVEAPFGYDRGKSAVFESNHPGATVTLDVTMTGTGNVNGIALDGSGTPLSFGRVEFTSTRWNDTITLNVPVQPDGRFSLNGVPTGDFNLKLTVSDRIGVGAATGTLINNQTIVQNLQIEPAAKIFGILKAEDGVNPSSSADVNLSLARQGGGNYSFVTHTDSGGYWEFTNVPLGTVSMTFSDPNVGGRAHLSGLLLTANAQELNAGTINLDNTSPAVQTVVPAGNSINVPKNSAVQITFTEPVAANSINTNTVRLMRGTSPIDVNLNLAQDGRTVTLTPVAILTDSTLYTVVVGISVRDRNDFPLTTEYRSEFTTADEIVPTVAQIAPSAGSIQIPVNTAIVVTASERLATDLNLSEAVQVKNGDLAVGGNATLNETGRIIRFVPSQNLEEGALYTITVSGLRDVAGNIQTQPVISAFATVDTTPPVVDPLPINGTVVRTFRPTINATFHDNASGVNPASVGLTLDGTLINSGIIVTAGNLSYTPPANLIGGSHTVTVRVTDNAGNISTARSATFTVADEIAPVVLGTIPVADARQVGLNDLIIVTFDEELDANQQFSSVIRIADTNSQVPVTGSYALSDDHKSVRFAPSNLVESRRYRIEVYGQKDIFGNAQSNHFNSYFVTVDNTVPTVSSFKINNRIAANGMTISTPRPVFNAAFSDNIAIDIYQTKLYLARQGAPLQPVPAIVNYNGLTYQPAEILQAGQYVTKLVVQDWVGNQTATPEILFTFGPQVPEIISVSPNYSYSSGNTITTIKGANLISGEVAANESERGLSGEYYLNNYHQFDELKLVRLDEQVNFDFLNESITPYISYGLDAVRWRGKIIPRYSEQYNFSALASGGFLVKINGQPVVNGEYSSSVRQIEGTITLEADQFYDIEIENIAYSYFGYYYGGRHVAKLSWSSPSQAVELVPAERLRPVGKAVYPMVKIGGVQATVIGAVSGEIDQVSVITPPRTVGTAGVQVENENGSVFLQNAVEYYLDEQPPQVVSFSPGSNNNNITPPTRISVTFNEPLAPNQNFNQILKVYNQADNSEIPGNVTIDETGWRLMFVPTNALNINTRYRIKVINYKDTLGNEETYGSSSDFTTTDTVSPVIDYLRPDQTTTINRRPTIEAAFSDAFSGINRNSIVLTIDNVSIYYGYYFTDTLSYTPPLPLSIGTHTVKLRVADNAGNVLEKISAFEIVNDGEPPTVNISYIAGRLAVDGMRTADRRPLFDIYFRDNGTIIGQSQKLYLGPQGGDVAQVGAYTYQWSSSNNTWRMVYFPPQDLPFGFYTYRYELVDDSGNLTTRTINFEVADLDITPPQVTAVNPESGAIQVNSNSNVTLTFSEPLDPSQNFSSSISVTDGFYNPVSGNYQLAADGRTLTFTPAQPLPSNSRYIVYAYNYLDVAGNGGRYFLSGFATNDTIAPIIQPGQLYVDNFGEEEWIQLNGAETLDRQPRIGISYNDATAGVNGSSIVFTLDGQTITEGTTPWGIDYEPVTPLSYGQHTITVQVADVVGNVSEVKSETFTVLRDPRTPFAVESDTELLWRLNERGYISSEYEEITPDASDNRIYGKFPPQQSRPAQKSTDSAAFSPTSGGRFGGAVSNPNLTSISDEHLTNIGTHGFTIEGWMKMAISTGDSAASGSLLSQPHTVWAKGNGSTNDFEMLLTPAGNLKARIYNSTGDPFEIELPKATYDVTDNRWHSLAMTVEATGGVAGEFKLYVDGVPRAAASVPGGFGAMRQSGGKFYLGFGDYTFNSRFDEVRISSTAHSAETISKIYNSTAALGLVVSRVTPAVLPSGNSDEVILEGYNLDTLTGASVTAIDGSQLPITATIIESSKTSAKIHVSVGEAVPGGEVKLSVTDGLTTLSRNLRIVPQRAFNVDPGTRMLFHLNEPDGSLVGNSGSLGGSDESPTDSVGGRFGGGRVSFAYRPGNFDVINSSFTGEFWVKTSLPSDDAPLMVYGEDYDGLNTKIIDLALTVRGQLKAVMKDINQLEWKAQTQIGAINVCDDQWHLVSMVVTRDGPVNQNNLKIYVDGVERASAGIPANFGTLPIQPNQRIFLNKFRNQSAPAELDEFRLLNYARTAVEIQNSWLGINTPGRFGILSPPVKNPVNTKNDFSKDTVSKVNPDSIEKSAQNKNTADKIVSPEPNKSSEPVKSGSENLATKKR